MTQMIYKIVPADLWREAEKSGIFAGASIDLADGFIHFSTAAQTKKTAELYFHGQDGLLLVAVEGETLGDALVYEASRGGDLFPHLYAPLATGAIAWQEPLERNQDGSHRFPARLA